jgi:hypothetical protein
MSVRVPAGVVLTAAVAIWIWVPLPVPSPDHAAGIALAVAALVVAGALVGRPSSLLLAAVLGVSVATVWYAGYDARTSESGSLDGVLLAAIASIAALVALAFGIALARRGH